ncbi:MAG: hypothetical protein H0Z29_04600 [Candidatus Marinimicrobia bacterium]|nr:hypothetical protein [Candidatus Neomarinimicrobiota bacterium]
MPVVTAKKPLRDKLGDDGVEALIELINEAQKETKNDVINFAEEKFEKRLSEELAKVKIEIAEVKSEIIKWMFIFWIGQIGAILGILFAFFKS